MATMVSVKFTTQGQCRFLSLSCTLCELRSTGSLCRLFISMGFSGILWCFNSVKLVYCHLCVIQPAYTRDQLSLFLTLIGCCRSYCFLSALCFLIFQTRKPSQLSLGRTSLWHVKLQTTPSQLWSGKELIWENM